MVYLDWAAAARPRCETIEYYNSLLSRNFANQESAHRLGYEARKELDSAAARLSMALFGNDNYAVIWGTSGTELFRLIADSPLAADKKVVTSLLEHPALMANLRRTARDAKFLAAKSDGELIPVKSEADLVAFHLIQSELGRIQVPEKLFDQYPKAIKILDAIQAAGRLPLTDHVADIVAISGHKFGSPGGGAALLVDKRSVCAKVLTEFSKNYRQVDYLIGRPEVPALLALVFAAELSCRDMGESLGRVRELNRFLRRELTNLDLPGGKKIFCTIPEELSSPYILHVMLPGIESGVIVRMLSESGVMVAAGSACSSESRKPSAALLAIGCKKADAWSGLRISLGQDSSLNDAKKLLEALRNVLKNW
ncbi:MAG: aminotransferase class V-fold PLP-dependent enzyme [Victivallales bacterium]|nr:aminotransferase class V-fold PLP-dependent enzyme [Victivallales bacterium]